MMVGIGMIAVGKSVPLESEIFKTLSNIVSIAQAGIIISEQLHYDQQSFIECTTDDFSLELPQDNTRINEPKLIESIEYEK
ncbi:MAG: hypothetical protein EOM76_04585 [Sphingobacteriia bacterium]|nr:hypothetical protein [Sphingobacteriia bacterium]